MREYYEMTVTHAAYCPCCRKVTNLSVSITLQSIAAQDGHEGTVLSSTYHCGSCLSFVRGEEEPFFYYSQGLMERDKIISNCAGR